MLELNFTPFPVLTTERLLLRQMELKDENEIYQLRSDERVNRFLDRQKADSIEDARKFITKINNGIRNNEGLMWAITLKRDPKLIGTAVYWNISRENFRAEIGYELLPDYQGLGIMQEALTKLIPFAFNAMKLKTITAYTNADNIQSVKVLEKFNFTVTSVSEDEKDTAQDAADTVIFALTNQETQLNHSA